MMTRMKAAVFSHNGLGDIILSLQISHNFSLNGWEVDTYHNGGRLLQEWYSHLPITPYPKKISDISELLHAYDQMVVFHNDTDDFVLHLIKEGKKHCPEKIRVIYACPTQSIEKKPYYHDNLFDYRSSMAQNMERFCRNILHLKIVQKHNGLSIPKTINVQKHANRVALHVTSSREGKNWPIQKYVKLALHLQQRGFVPYFIVGGPKEYAEWSWLKDQGYRVPKFDGINDVALFIAGCSYLIGNDSGLGHLASSLGIPTITISRRSTVANFWKPDWTENRVVTPASWIPNIRLYRFRDRNWKKLISVRKVLHAFEDLQKTHSK